MATRKKAKGKTKPTRKKTSPTKATTRRKTTKVRKNLAKKAPARRASPKKARPAANAAIKPTPVHVGFPIGLECHKYQRGSTTARSSAFALSQRPDVIDEGEYSDTHDRLGDFS
jgi:hypothetical protein